MNREATSGLIRLEYDCVSYQLSTGLAAPRIIGEHSDRGGLVDDYFGILTDSDLYEVSIYVEGWKDFFWALAHTSVERNMRIAKTIHAVWGRVHFNLGF